MASVITIAGEQLFAAKAQANEQLDIDTFIFANVPNQDPNAPINREEGIPAANIVYQQNVQQVGRINDNVVVYSTVLDSITGPFEFNWVGLYSSVNQKLVAINHVPIVTKTATAPGAAGNTLNRNFGIEYSGIADLTGITVEPETWQLDFTARLSGMDLLTQQLAADMNGKDWFIDDGLKVVPRTTANTFSVTPGVGYVSGLRVELKQEHILIVQSYPQFVYVDAWFSGNANSTWSPQLAFTVTNTEMADYIDPSGTKHYVYKLAVINAADDVDDLRNTDGLSQQVDNLKSAIDNRIKQFYSIAAMIAATPHTLGNKYSTGLTRWTVNADGKGIAVAGGVICPESGFAHLIDFDIIHDATTDNKIALDYAASLNIPVELGEGLIGSSGTHTFNAAIKGKGSAVSGFVNLDTSSAKTYLITVQNHSDTCYGFSVDGNASCTSNTKNQDPASWNSTNYNNWFGTRGILFYNCPDIHLADIRSRNSAMYSGFRLERCDNAVLTRCYQRRARGSFGDGFYHVGCKGVKYNYCSSWDITRIGFVSEGNAVTSKISTLISYNDCSVGYAHDGSVNYGGTEYAAGYWAENSAEITYFDSKAEAIEHFGFIYAPTTMQYMGQTYAGAKYFSCICSDSNNGYLASPLVAGFDHKVTYVSCSARNIVKQAFLARPLAGCYVNVIYESCHAHLLGADINSNAYSAETRHTETTVDLQILNCTTSWSDTSKLSDTAANTGDVTQFEALGTANIKIDGLTNITTGKAFIKLRQSSASNYNYAIKGGAVNLYTVSGGEINLTDVDIYGSAKAKICKMTKVAVTEGKILILTDTEVYGDASIKDAILHINHTASMSSTKKIMGRIDVTIDKNIAATDYALRIQCEQAIKPTFVINGTFYNSGTVAADDKNFIWIVRSGTNVFTTGVIKDDTVPNIYRANTTPGNFPVGQQSALMH